MYKVWIKRNYVEIKGIGEGIYKIVVQRLYRMVFISITFHNTLKDYFVCPSINTLNFSMIPFGPHFVYTMECVSCLCLKIANGMHLSQRKWLKVLDLVISQQPD
jgi:hypothetical protein